MYWIGRTNSLDQSVYSKYEAKLINDSFIRTPTISCIHFIYKENYEELERRNQILHDGGGGSGETLIGTKSPPQHKIIEGKIYKNFENKDYYPRLLYLVKSLLKEDSTKTFSDIQ